MALGLTEHYLSIIKGELSSRILPALESAHVRQIVNCSEFILSKLLVDQRDRPRLGAIAIGEISFLVEELGSLLTGPNGRALMASLRAGLASGSDFDSIQITLQAISTELNSHVDRSSAIAMNRTLVDIEARFQESYVKALMTEASSVSASEVQKPILTGDQQDSLTRWLRETFPGNAALQVGGLKLIPGGFSKQTIFVSLDNAATLPDTIVLRMDWTESFVGSSVVNELHIIDCLYKAGVKVPKPFALEESGKVLGCPFLVLSKAEGINPGDSFDVHAGSMAFGLDLARNLAKLHSVSVEHFGNVEGANVSTIIRLQREIEKFEANWRALDKPSVSMETAFTWLKANIALADGPRRLVHTDCGFHNMLMHADQLSALLDWETAVIGNPAQDLGYVMPLVEQICDWQDFVNAYIDAGGPAVDQVSIAYYKLWSSTWVNAMVMQAQSAFESGKIADIRAGFAGAYLVNRTEARLRGTLRQTI